MTPRTNRRFLVLVGILLVGGTACAGPTETRAATTAEPGESALVAGAYANPLDPVMFPDPTQQRTITAAAEALVATCMTERGHTYVPGDAFPPRRTADDAQYTYSVTDPAVAERYGFHPASWVEEVTRGATDRARDAAYTDALFGRTDAKQITDDEGVVIATYDPSSCVGRAKDEVTPHWAEQERIYLVAADILLAVSDDAAEAPEVVEARRAWQACMKEQGYEYDGPMDANGDERFSTDLPTADEIPVAVASATCQHDSGLLRAWSRARAQLTQAELDRHPGIVSQWLELQNAAATAAQG